MSTETDTKLDMTEAINENSENVNAITQTGGLKLMGAVSGLRMAMTVDRTTAIIHEHNIGGGTDLSFVTATAGDILSGKIGSDADGNPINGTIATVTASLTDNVVTVPQGFIASKQTLTVAEMSEPSVSGNVVTIAKGYNKAEKTVSIPDAGTLTVDGNVVTIPAGYNPTQQTVTIPEAGALTVSGNKVTCPVGYVKSVRTAEIPAVSATLSANTVTIPAGYNAGQTLTVAEAAEPTVEGNKVTVYPGYVKAEQTIETEGGGMDFFKCAAVHGPYKVTRIKVSGAGTTAVNGDYELTELKSGSNEEVWKLIGGNHYLYKMNGYSFGIDTDYNKEPYQALYYAEIYSETPDPTSGSWYTGYDYSTDTATGTTPVPTLSKIQVTMDEDVPKTWDGYKAILTDGVYVFEENLTTGLSYSAFEPEVGKVYSADALIEVKKLFDGTDPHLLLYFSMDDTGKAIDKVNGIELSAFGNASGGVPGVIGNCWQASDGGYLSGSNTAFALPKVFTFNLLVNFSSSGSEAVIFEFGSYSSNSGYGFYSNSEGEVSWRVGNSGWGNYSSSTLSADEWSMLTVTCDGSSRTLYINGVSENTYSVNTVVNTTSIGAFSRAATEGSGASMNGKIDEVQLWDYAMTADEVTALYNKLISGSGNGI